MIPKEKLGLCAWNTTSLGERGSRTSAKVSDANKTSLWSPKLITTQVYAPSSCIYLLGVGGWQAIVRGHCSLCEKNGWLILRWGITPGGGGVNPNKESGLSRGAIGRSQSFGNYSGSDLTPHISLIWKYESKKICMTIVDYWPGWTA